eukprot:2816108-Alexandrium_andersonii.AAC.1
MSASLVGSEMCIRDRSCGVGRCSLCGLRSPWAFQGRRKVGRLLRVRLCVVSLFGLWLAVGAAAASLGPGVGAWRRCN